MAASAIYITKENVMAAIKVSPSFGTTYWVPNWTPTWTPVWNIANVA
jgi:hypothetical protein